MKFRVKTLEEIEKITVFTDVFGMKTLPATWDDKKGYCPGFTVPMELYCGKEIELIGWDGWSGRSKSYKWSLPMLEEVKEMNRNGANACE